MDKRDTCRKRPLTDVQEGEESSIITAVWTPGVGALVTERVEMCL